MILNFLAASVPLTKSYSKDPAGTISKTPYPFIWEVTSDSVQCSTLLQLATLLKAKAVLGHSLLKGNIARPLVSESRAGSTNATDTTEYLVLDLDGLPETWNDKKLTVDAFLNEIGLADISYVIQWSASYGIDNKKIRAHIFMLLDKPYTAPSLKQWLKQKNLETPLLADALELTSTGNALKWPLDISACQNDKLIYIAPPILKNIVDPVPKGQRIQIVNRKHSKFALAGAINFSGAIKNKEQTKIAELRKAKGYAPRKFKTKMAGSTEYLVGPDEAEITETKEERGFVYFNLNDGDSWAYYHPANNAEFIYNFKGEPAYKTSELLPNYWAQVMSNPTPVSLTGPTYLAFLDKASNVYWRGWYDPSTDELDLHMARSDAILRNACRVNKISLGDTIPEWDLTFDPTDTVRVDPINRTVNTFAPTLYMKNSRTKKVAAPPKTILKVIQHAVGGEKDIAEYLINWLAYIIQYRDRTNTAWILHGTQGTGKGLLMDKIMRPLLGFHHTEVKRMEEFADKNNSFIENSFLVFVDEVQTSALKGEKGVIANIKNYITEKRISIVEKYATTHEARNYSNWIFASNMRDPVHVEEGDRRFNVAKYQNEKLKITSQEIDLIEKELQTFYDYLANLTCDVDKAQKVMETEARSALIAISATSATTVVNKIIEGDFAYFLEQLPTDNSHEKNALKKNKVEDYKDTLKTLIARTIANSNGVCKIGREELRAIFEYTVGEMRESTVAFSLYLGHNGLPITHGHWINGKSMRGYEATWKDHTKFTQYQAEHFLIASPSLKLVPGVKTAKSKPKKVKEAA